MEFPWFLFIDLGIISFTLIIATAIRARVRFFQRYLIPNALTAGFILLVFYNYVAPLLGLGLDNLRSLAYHLLNISFVAMTLRHPGPSAGKTRRRAFGMAVGLISQYAVQATLGLVLTFVFIWTVMPKLFPGFGLLVPLGFSLGPGQAFAIGNVMERFGFKGGGSIGLTFAALGFLWACFGGVPLLNIGIRKGWISTRRLKSGDGIATNGIYPRGTELPVGSRLTTESEAIDAMSINTAVTLFVYLGSYLLLQGLSWALSFAGKMGQDLAANLWGIAFIFATIVAMLVRRIFDITRFDHVLDDGSLTRLSGVAVDILLAASLGALSIAVVIEYWLPILVMSTVAGVLCVVMLPWMGSRMFDDFAFERMIIIYGCATGTLATGLALLRVADPDFETPVATDYMFSSALVFVLAIPMILMINLPSYGYSQGNPMYYWAAFAICIAYMIFTLVGYWALAGRKAFKQPGRLWLVDGGASAGKAR
jgi:glutamate:Na+ symporter, ESS family